ncbi:MAG: flagellar biosynthesis protein FlhB [Betaproteobacteria bacterium]|nr:flagellar biosynthesis protein FlhB [Betaproteobacteria bacterium]
MADDSDLERTEPASGRRLDQARSKGQVPRSRELNTLAILFAGGGTLMLMGNTLMGRLEALMRQGLTLAPGEPLGGTALFERFQHEAYGTLLAFLPFLAVLAVAAVGSSVLLSGWLFSFEALQPSFSRLNPVSGLSRLVSLHGLIELVKALIKTVVVGGIAAWVIWGRLGALMGLAQEPFGQATAHMAHLTGTTFLLVSASMMLIALFDVPYQIWDYNENLKMTKEEVRQEAKDSEGDPHIKSRIRSLQREAARRRMMAAVPKADVIVVNPTHYAVALQYQDDRMRAPQVVAKGERLVAKRILELAEGSHVPVLRAPPLARALYHHAELGAEIPAALYTAVAEVLAYIYQLRRYHSAGGVPPAPPDALPVPPDLDPGGEAA